MPNFWRIPEVFDRVRTLLKKHAEGGPQGNFLPAIGKGEVGRKLKLRVALAGTFAASLELSRRQVLEAEQNVQLEEVMLRAT